MKVLFLTYCYPPQKYPRSVQISHLVQSLKKDFPLKVITALAENGGDKSLLDFTPLDNVIYAAKSKITCFIERAKGHRLKKAILPDFHYPWHFDLYKTALDHIQKNGADVIVTFGQPMSTHISGLKLKKKFPEIKWIAHFSDPWFDNIFNEYNNWTRFINKHYQDKVFKNADKLIFTSQETIDLAMHSYPITLRDKTECLPHSFNQALYQPNNNQSSNFTIRYLGNFYGNRQPHFLFEALKTLQKNQLFKNPFKVELVGASTSSIEESIKSYNLQASVSARPSVNYLESLQLMQESDLLLIIDAPTEKSPFLPSKLVDYIGADKPIFGITPPGASQSLIEEMGFEVAHPNKPQEIAEKLSKMVHKIQSNELMNIPPQIRNRYAVDVVGAQMGAIMKGTACTKSA